MRIFQNIYMLHGYISHLRQKYTSCVYYHTSKIMAKSKYEYVKSFESDVKLLPNCWIVVRLDGKGFHKFADLHDFSKPNDKRALDLMNRCATTLMQNFQEVVLSYGQSDEYSFIFRKDTGLYGRRSSKIMTTLNSLFASAYVYYWSEYFGSVKLQYPPSFDARVVLYPSDTNLRDYLCWRQADVHINNLYNLAFWSLVLHKNITNAEAEERLRGTLSSHKNELLFSEFGINYSKEPVMFRKGTALLRKFIHLDNDCETLRKTVIPFFCDFFQDSFWEENPEILGREPLQIHYVSCDKDNNHPFIKCENSVGAVSETISVTLEKSSLGNVGSDKKEKNVTADNSSGKEMRVQKT